MVPKFRARKPHQRTPANATTRLRPTARSTNNPHRTHKDHFKHRITIVVWSHSSPGCYEAQFCPACPEEDAQTSLRVFRGNDSSLFARESWLVYRGLNSETLRRTYDPDSAGDMADVMQLLAKHDFERGRINLAIVPKGLVVSISILLPLAVLVVVTIIVITFPHQNENVNRGLLQILGGIYGGLLTYLFKTILM